MRDIELYQQILGLEEPWSVKEVELNIDEGRVDIHVEHPPGVKWKCPHCERELSCYDHSAERTWRHLDTCQLSTHLHARIPRVQCEEHGVVQVAVPWAQEHGRFTLLMERMIIQALLACQTTKGACQLMRISWDQAWHVTERAVARGQARKEAVVRPQIGVDEKAFRKGHSYMTVVNDIQRGTVEFVTEDREKASLERYFATLSDEQRSGIEGVAMDMWEPYVQATLEALPLAKEKIVFDRFHVMQHMTKARDVRGVAGRGNREPKEEQPSIFRINPAGFAGELQPNQTHRSRPTFSRPRPLHHLTGCVRYFKTTSSPGPFMDFIARCRMPPCSPSRASNQCQFFGLQGNRLQGSRILLYGRARRTGILLQSFPSQAASPAP